MTEYGDQAPGQRAGAPGRLGEAPIDRRTERTGDPEIDEIVTDIEETRGEMSVTVEAIGEKLDPGNIVADAKQTVRDATVGRVEQMANQAGEVIDDAGRTAQQTGAGIAETIRQNPIPAAMVGLGLGWLWMNRSSGDGGQSGSGRQRYGYGARGYGAGSWPTAQARPARGYEQQGWYEPGGGQSGEQGGLRSTMQGGATQATERAGQVAGQAQQAAGEVAGQVQEAAGQMAYQAQELAGQAGYRAESLARDLQHNAQRMLHENPLAVGAIAVAVGAAIGAALPGTRREQEMLSPLVEQADQVVQQVESTAEEQLRGMEEQAKQSG